MKNKTTYNRTMHDKTHPYTMVSAKLINNTDLSGEERFLLIYLLGRSNDYIFNSSYFANDAQKLFGWGRDRFYKFWNSLKEKGYITKETIRNKGMIAGQHYTVHEILPKFLNNQNTENPESGESGIRCTSALPSIDKPIIDKPNNDEPNSACGTTKTNQGECLENPDGGSESPFKILEKNDQVKQIFDLICERNPSEHSDKWKMNDQDRALITKAIDDFGFDAAKVKVYHSVGINENLPYTSVSYIFSDFKEKPENEITEFLQENSEVVPDFIKAAFSDDKVETAKTECDDEQEFFNFIKEAVTTFHSDAKHWTASDEDLVYCQQLKECDPNIELAQKLRDGLKSAIDKEEWRFGQIVYQAITAIETWEIAYS